MELETGPLAFSNQFLLFSGLEGRGQNAASRELIYVKAQLVARHYRKAWALPVLRRFNLAYLHPYHYLVSTEKTRAQGCGIVWYDNH